MHEHRREHQHRRDHHPARAGPHRLAERQLTDVEAGVRLLTEVLGFVLTAIHRDDDGTVQHAEARRPEGGNLWSMGTYRGE